MLSEDKGMYNTFNYNLKKVHEDVQEALKEYYKKLTQDKIGNAAEIKSLMECVIETKGTKIPPKVMEHLRKTRDVTSTNEGGAWIPWKEAVAKYGEDILTEMVIAKTIASRTNAMLPPNSKIEWPRNLEVAALTESWNNKRMSIDETSNEVPAGSSTDFENKFDEVQNMVKKMRADTGMIKKKTPEDAGKPGALPIPEQDKVAVANIRKAHTAWDRNRREFSALISKSSSHANTKGCKFELDLQALVPQGITLQFMETFKVMTICLFVVGGPPRSARIPEIDFRTWRVSILSHHVTGKTEDEVLQKLEQTFMRGETFTNDDLSLAAATCTKMADIIKTGNKKAVALKPWFKIDD